MNLGSITVKYDSSAPFVVNADNVRLERTILCMNQLTFKTKVLSFDNSLTHEIRLVVDMKIFEYTRTVSVIKRN